MSWKRTDPCELFVPTWRRLGVHLKANDVIYKSGIALKLRVYEIYAVFRTYIRSLRLW